MSGKEKSSRRRSHHGGAHAGGHHGGAWKVAYADFTTAMMAFFMLMWILAASSPKQKEAIAQYFRNEGHIRDGGGASMTGTMNGGPGFMQMPVHNSIVEESQTLEMTAKELGDALEEGGAAGLTEMKDQVSITLTDDGLVIEITDDSQQELFAVGGADMNPAFQATLDAVAAQLKGLPNSVRVEGYTDARPYPPGGEYSNWELSADRANAARRHLEAKGLPRGRVESVIGYGDGRLAAPASPLAPANRRITITVLREHPVEKSVDPKIEEAVPNFRPFGETVQPSRGHATAAGASDSGTGHSAAGTDRNAR
jgi:chemotaxis protein MotB